MRKFVSSGIRDHFRHFNQFYRSFDSTITIITTLHSYPSKSSSTSYLPGHLPYKCKFALKLFNIMAEDKVKTGPSVFLSEILGQQVKVKLNNGVTYLGNLNSIDGYMNIVMDSTSEHVNGQDFVKNYGDVFIRGNNVLYISQV